MTYVQVRGDLFIVVILFIVFLLLYFAFVLLEVVDTSTLEEAALQANIHVRTRTALAVLRWKYMYVCYKHKALVAPPLTFQRTTPMMTSTSSAAMMAMRMIHQGMDESRS